MKKIILITILLATLLLTGCTNEQDLSPILEEIGKLQIEPTVCPACNCPKYEEVICETNSIDTILSLDKFQFRYEIIKNNYKDIRKNIDDKAHCKEEIASLKEDLNVALSYVQEFALKTNPSDADTYSYEMFSKGQDSFQEYLLDIELYCQGTTDKIDSKNYDSYLTYTAYYNNITGTAKLKDVELLKEVNE